LCLCGSAGQQNYFHLFEKKLLTRNQVCEKVIPDRRPHANDENKKPKRKMKTLTRKSLIKKLNALHEATEVGESQKRFLLEAFIDNLNEGFLNIHQAARILREKGFAI
jgi:hypothetical protein